MRLDARGERPIRRIFLSRRLGSTVSNARFKSTNLDRLWSQTAKIDLLHHFPFHYVKNQISLLLWCYWYVMQPQTDYFGKDKITILFTVTSLLRCQQNVIFSTLPSLRISQRKCEWYCWQLVKNVGIYRFSCCINNYFEERNWSKDGKKKNK